MTTQTQTEVTTTADQDTEETPPPVLTTLPHFPSNAEELRKSDIQLVEVALKRGWPLSDKTKLETVKAAEWIRDNSRDPRARLRAAEFLLQVDKHHLEIVKAFRPQEVSIDVTSNGKPLTDTSRLSDDELAARRAALQAAVAGQLPSSSQ